jgi:DDE superfamily endonuclease
MSSKHHSSATEHFNKLIQFRQAAYKQLGNGRDALFELSDAVIQMRCVQSFAELSCAPVFRRKWSSAYEAVQDSCPERDGLSRLYLEQVDLSKRLILAGDHTAWPRIWAETLEGRSYQHQANPIPGRRPVTIGHGYSTLAIIPQSDSSWALPFPQQRITHQKPAETGAEQLREVCPHLGMRPLSLWDSEYSTAVFLKATADVAADKLIRLRTNLCLEGPTKPYHGRGQHPKHGIKFKFKDPTTWWAADEEWQGDDPEFGMLRVRIWKGLRFSKALECHLAIALVERLQAPGTRRKPKFLWFAWAGDEPPAQWWNLYHWRYPIDHWYRFAKGRLHWILPRFATPQQCDRWSDLMTVLTWELWLARDLVEDSPLPWQKPQTRLTPGRVCQSMQNILVAIGTPACPCKSRGIPPGWPKGRPRSRRQHYALIRSEIWKIKRARKKAIQAGQPGKRGRRRKIDALKTA